MLERLSRSEKLALVGNVCALKLLFRLSLAHFIPRMCVHWLPECLPECLNDQRKEFLGGLRTGDHLALGAGTPKRK